MLSPNRYTAEALQTQHANEKPWTTQQNATQPVPPSPEEMASNPTKDFAHVILAADTRLDDETRANAWDIYHTSATPKELVRNLSSLSIPNSTTYALWTAKSATDPVRNNAEKVANALHQMSQMNPALLDMAEKYKHVAKMMIDAAVKSDEE